MAAFRIKELDPYSSSAQLRQHRASAPSIASARSLNDGPIDIRNEGLERPVIIPFQDGTAWGFAVAYPDCTRNRVSVYRNQPG